MRHFLQILFCGIALCSSFIAFAGGPPTVTGTISRDTSVDRFDFTVTLTDSSKPDLTSKETDLFKDRLRIYLKALSTRDAEYVPFAGSPAVAGVPFTVHKNGEVVKTKNSNNKTDFTFAVRITADQVGGLKTLLTKEGGNSISLYVRYYEDGSLVEKNETAVLSVSTEIVEGAPTSISGTGIHKSIVAKWANPATFDWTGSSTATPSEVVAIVLDKSATDLNVPAYLYNSAAATDSAAPDDTCVFQPSFSDGESCISCSDATAYINPDALESMSANGFFVAKSAVTAASIKISNLENTRPYAVAMFYRPGGLNQSTCVTVTPEADATWSEVNGEKSASLTDPKCFIATAAYGSSLHKNLQPLRWFRDHVLLRTDMGQAFVTWYYKYGPEAAMIIQHSEALKLLTQVALWAPVFLLTMWMSLANATSFAIATTVMAFGILGSLLLASKTIFGRLKLARTR